MATDLPISGLPPVTIPSPLDQFGVVSDDVSKRMTRAQVHALQLGENISLPQGNDPTDAELQFGDGGQGVYEDAAGLLSFAQGSLKIAGMTTPALGGMFVNNTLTGGGLERVLTVSDGASFGEYRTTFDASGAVFPTTSNQGDWFNCTIAGTVGGQAFVVGDILIALIDNPSTTIFSANWTVVPHVGVSTLNSLSDVDLTGQANNDLLFRSAGTWIDTAGLLTWSGSQFAVTGHTLLSGNNSFITPANRGLLYHSDANGLIMLGEGTLTDLMLVNKSGSVVMQIATGGLDTIFSGKITINGSDRPGLSNLAGTVTVPTLLPSASETDSGISGEGAGNTIGIIVGSLRAVSYFNTTQGINYTANLKTGVGASITQTQGQTTLSSGEYTEITIVGNTDDVVTLGAVTVGRKTTLCNTGLNRLQIFPTLGDAILPNAINISVTLDVNNSITFFGLDDTNWIILSKTDVLSIAIQSGVSAITIDGDIGDTTTPYISIFNTGINVDRRILQISESSESAEAYLDADFSGTADLNGIIFGTGSSATLTGTGIMHQMLLNGDHSFSEGWLSFDFSENLIDTNLVFPNGLDFNMGDSIGDRISLFNGLDTTTTFGLGIETGTLYSKAQLQHRWYVNVNADGGTSDTMELTATLLTVNADISGKSGASLTLFDSTNVDSLILSCNLNSASIAASSVASLAFTGATGQYTFDNTIQSLSGGISVFAGEALNIIDSVGTDSLAISHDGSDINFVNTLTVNWNITGLTGDIFQGTQLLDPSRSTINTQNSSYTLVLTDKGKTVRKTSVTTSQTYTIPANGSVAFPDGTLIAIQNDGSVSMSIAITTDTLTSSSGLGTGTRTLASGGTAVIQKVAATNWKISGDQLT